MDLTGPLRAKEKRVLASVIMNETLSTTDSTGRKLSLRKLNALDKYKLFKAIGADDSTNAMVLGYATLAASVTEIDGIPNPTNSSALLERAIGILGDEGMEAVAQALQAAMPAADEVAAAAKN